jgi:hypothetical protein
MSRWVRSGTALAVVVVLVAALAVIATIHTAGLGRAAPVWSTMDSNGRLPQGNPGNVHWEVGTYMSDNLQIYGLICRPNSAGQHPVLMLNHGIGGIGASQVSGCINLAAAGWLVATSTYRGGLLEPMTGLPSPFGLTFTHRGVNLNSAAGRSKTCSIFSPP